jgi:hypothetical protein
MVRLDKSGGAENKMYRRRFRKSNITKNSLSAAGKRLAHAFFSYV